MLSLYHTPESRSSRIIWLLEELGLDYNLVHCEIQLSDGIGSTDPKNPHPEKRVPALVHDGRLVTEQSAIALYLTDAFPNPELGVRIGDAARAPYLSWLVFYASEVDPLYKARKYYRGRLHPKTIKDSLRVVSRVSDALVKGPFLLGDRFSAADILVSGPLEWSLAWDPDYVSESEPIMSWLKRLADRPAASRALVLDKPSQVTG